MNEKEMIDQTMGVAWLVTKYDGEIASLQAQLSERDKIK